MRKIILWMHVSLDDFTAGPKGELDWLFEHVMTEEAWKYKIDLLSTVDTVLLGRVNYQGYASYWPTVALNPSSTKNDIDFSQWLDNTTKIVFSRSLEKVEWKIQGWLKKILRKIYRNLNNSPVMT